MPAVMHLIPNDAVFEMPPEPTRFTIAASRVARAASFIDPGLFATFRLPQAIPAAAAPVPGR